MREQGAAIGAVKLVAAVVSLDDVGDETSDMEGEGEQQAKRAAEESDRCQDLCWSPDVRQLQAAKTL